MADQRVPVVRTTPSMLAFARALLRAWRTATGTLPTKPQAGVLWAHFAGETLDGVYCWNHNLGNVKFVAGGGGKFMSLAGVWEGFRYGDEDKDGDVDDNDRVLFVARMVRTGLWKEDPSKDHAIAVGPSKVSLIASANNPTTFFRAYDNLEEGMSAFVSRKADQRKNARGQYVNRYATAWPFVLAGDCDGYARELGRRGYYTASPDAYSRAMLRKHAAWMLSDAFDEALAELLATLEAKTLPEMPSSPPDTEPHPLAGFVKVPAKLEFPPRIYDLDDPGEDPKS
jgi:hypothetical protein